MIATFGPEIIGALITGVFILLAAWIAYSGGLKTYFKKREHQQIMKRYLEEGIDLISARVDHILCMFLHNYWTAVDILDQIKLFKTADLSVNLRRAEGELLNLTPFYRVEYLIGDQIFWRYYSKLFGQAHSYTSFFEKKFPLSVKMMLEGKMEISDKSINGLRKIIDEFYEKLEDSYSILWALQSVASVLEKETTLSFSDLSEFKNRAEIKESIERLKRIFDGLETISPKDKQKISKSGQPTLSLS